MSVYEYTTRYSCVCVRELIGNGLVFDLQALATLGGCVLQQIFRLSCYVVHL